MLFIVTYNNQKIKKKILNRLALLEKFLKKIDFNTIILTKDKNTYFEIKIINGYLAVRERNYYAFLKVLFKTLLLDDIYAIISGLIEVLQHKYDKNNVEKLIVKCDYDYILSNVKKEKLEWKYELLVNQLKSNKLLKEANYYEKLSNSKKGVHRYYVFYLFAKLDNTEKEILQQILESYFESDFFRQLWNLIRLLKYNTAESILYFNKRICKKKVNKK